MLGEWLREGGPALRGLLGPVVTIWGVVLANVRFSGQAGGGRGREPRKNVGEGGNRPRLLSLAGLRICEVEEVLFLLAGVLGSARGGRLPQRSLVSPEEAGHSCLFPDHFYICLVWAPWWGSWASLCPHMLCPHMLCPHMRAPEHSGPLIVPPLAPSPTSLL